MGPNDLPLEKRPAYLSFLIIVTMCFHLLVIELWAKSILTMLINFLHLRSDPKVGDSRAHAATQQWLLYDSVGPFLMVTSRPPQLQASHPHLPIHKADREEKEVFSLCLLSSPFYQEWVYFPEISQQISSLWRRGHWPFHSHHVCCYHGRWSLSRQTRMPSMQLLETMFAPPAFLDFLILSMKGNVCFWH